MKKWSVAQLTPGMAFSQAVYIDSDNMLADAYEAISAADIERLTRFSIKEVQSAGEPTAPRVTVAEPAELGLKERIDNERITKAFRDTWKQREAILKMLNEGEHILQEVYEGLNEEKAMQLNRVRSLAEDLVRMVDEAPLMQIYIYDLLAAPNTFRHVLAAAVFAIEIGVGLEYSKPRLTDAVFGILLMDVGMMRVPVSIQEKDSKLSEAEIRTLHAHPVEGYRILTSIARIKNTLAQVALEHQECIDGSGYPRNLKGDQISEASRMAMIADSYAAILESKAWRKARVPNEAMKELLSLGQNRYDSGMMKVFLDRMSYYPIGSVVTTSEGVSGLVVGTVPGKPMRPVILVLRDKNGAIPAELKFQHLLHHPSLYITASKTAADLGLSIESEIARAARNL